MKQLLVFAFEEGRARQWHSIRIRFHDGETQMQLYHLPLRNDSSARKRLSERTKRRNHNKLNV